MYVISISALADYKRNQQTGRTIGKKNSGNECVYLDDCELYEEELQATMDKHIGKSGFYYSENLEGSIKKILNAIQQYKPSRTKECYRYLEYTDSDVKLNANELIISMGIKCEIMVEGEYGTTYLNVFADIREVPQL